MKTEQSKSQATVTSLDDMPVILNVNLIQNILGISRAKAYDLVKTVGFPKIKIGKRIAIPKAEFEKWLQNKMENEEDLL